MLVLWILRLNSCLVPHSLTKVLIPQCLCLQNSWKIRGVYFILNYCGNLQKSLGRLSQNRQCHPVCLETGLNRFEFFCRNRLKKTPGSLSLSHTSLILNLISQLSGNKVDVWLQSCKPSVSGKLVDLSLRKTNVQML